MKVIETQDFSTDILSIDNFLEGKIIQDTWQDNPILSSGKEFIIYRDLIKDVVGDRPIFTITYIEEEDKQFVTYKAKGGEIVYDLLLADRDDDILAGVQTHIDITVSFKVSGKRQVKTFSFTEESEPWTNQECINRVIKEIEENGIN